MNILIIKTSSLGDVVHTLPALTDAKNNIENISFDWVVEPAFADIPAFHTNVGKIIPAALRKWRKSIFNTLKNGEWQHFYHMLREKQYDLVIDAQGLIKSGFLAFLSKGIKCGYDRHSAWELFACLAYDKKFNVDPNQHAITRIRKLFSQALGYPLPSTSPDYGIKITSSPLEEIQTYTEKNYCVFLHGTTREDKCWPESHWLQLIEYLKTSSLQILLPWGNAEEKERAEKLAHNQPHVTVLPKLSIKALAHLLFHAKFNVAVDTGLGHLSAALSTPTISLYGPTDPALIGAIGENQLHLKAETLSAISAKEVMDKLNQFPFNEILKTNDFRVNVS